MPPEDEEDFLDIVGQSDDIDDEMRGLLDQLDSPDVDLMTPDMPGIDGDNSPPLETIEQPIPEPLKPVEIPRTQDTRTVDVQPAIVPVELVKPTEDTEPVVDLRKQFAQFDAVAEEVLQGTRHDRQEIQEAINLCRGEINKAVNNNANPSRMWVDNLAKVLEVKATVNLTAIKALEAKAKLIAASKAGIQVNNNNVNQNSAVSTVSDDSLVDLLNNNPLNGNPGGEDEY